MTRGIGIRIFPDLDLAAMAAVIAQMKAAFGRAGTEISGSLNTSEAAPRRLQDDMVRSANAAANAEIAADKRAADAIIANRRAMQAELVAENQRSIAQQRAILMAPIAGKRSSQAQKESEQASARATKAAEEHSKAMGNATASTLALSSVVNGVGIASLAVLGLAMDHGVKSAADLQSAIQRVVSTAGESVTNISTVSNGLLQISSQWGVSLKELYEGLYMTEKAGYHGADALKVLNAAAQTSVSEHADLAEVVKGGTTTMSDYGLSADKAAEVFSKLIAVTGEAKSNITEFFSSLHSVEPLASKVGISPGDTTGVLAQLTQSGQSPADASQNERFAINAMLKPNQVQRAAMLQRGINPDEISRMLPQRGLAGTYQHIDQQLRSKMTSDQIIPVDANAKNTQAVADQDKMLENMSGHARKLAEALRAGTISNMEYAKAARHSNQQDSDRLRQFQQLQTRVDGFSDTLKKGKDINQTYAQTVTDITGGVAAQSVYMQTTGIHTAETNEKIKVYNSTLAEADGTVKGANASMATLHKQWDATKESFGAFATEMGQVFIPELQSMAHWLAQVGQELTKHPQLAHGVVLGLEGIVGAWTAIKLMNVVSTILNPTTVALGALTTAEESATVAAGGLRGALSGLAGMAGPIAALGAALWTLKPQIESGMNVRDAKTPDGGVDWWKLAVGNGPGGWLEKNYNDLVHPQPQKPPAPNFYKQWYPESNPPPIPEMPIPAPESPAPGPSDGGGMHGTPESGLAAGLKEKKPSGHRNDPVYTLPAEHIGSGNNPLQDIVSKFGSQGFGLPALAGLMTTFLAEMAMGNPLGKMQTGQVSQYAWWSKPHQAGQSASSPMYVKDVDASGIMQRAQNSLTGGKQGVANTIVDHALAHGYSMQEIPAILATAIGESGLNPMADGGIQGGNGTEADRTLGIYQQKASWGSVGERQNPASAAEAFLNRLDQTSGSIWPRITTTQVGPPASYYQQYLPQANQYLRGYTGGMGVAPSGFGIPHLGGQPAGPAMKTSQSFTGGSKGGGGMQVSGGVLGAAEGAAAMAANAFAPGAGAAAQLAMQEANRFAAYLGQAAATGTEGLLETFSLSGTDLSGRNVDMSKSLIGKVITGISGARPNVNDAGSPMQTNPAAQKGQTNSTTHNGDVNQTGVRIENMNFQRGDDGDDVMKSIRQQSMSVGGDWINRPSAMP